MATFASFHLTLIELITTVVVAVLFDVLDIIIVWT